MRPFPCQPARPPTRPPPQRTQMLARAAAPAEAHTRQQRNVQTAAGLHVHHVWRPALQAGRTGGRHRRHLCGRCLRSHSAACRRCLRLAAAAAAVASDGCRRHKVEEYVLAVGAGGHQRPACGSRAGWGRAAWGCWAGCRPPRRVHRHRAQQLRRVPLQHALRRRPSSLAFMHATTTLLDCGRRTCRVGVGPVGAQQRQAHKLASCQQRVEGARGKGGSLPQVLRAGGWMCM